MHHITVPADDSFWKECMEPKLCRFYEQCMVPEIVDSRVARSMIIRELEYIQHAKKAAGAKKPKLLSKEQ